MYVFLTACRNEERILPAFLAEFAEMIKKAGLEHRSRLCVVDDLSTDGSVAVLEQFGRSTDAIELKIILAPTNFGNQGAMFFGLRTLEVQPDDIIITFDCDGEDDVAEIPSIIELGARNPDKVVLIERGRRKESLQFKVFFAAYKALFRFFTTQTIVPNNFLLIPGRLVPVMQSSPLGAVHFAYAILKLRPSYVATKRDRRTRYGGKTSQNLFMLVSHGLVGLMLFYEVAIAKIFMLFLMFGAFTAAVVGVAAAIPSAWTSAHRALILCGISAGVAAVVLFGLLLAAALALIMKLAVYTLVGTGVRDGERRARV